MLVNYEIVFMSKGILSLLFFILVLCWQALTVFANNQHDYGMEIEARQLETQLIREMRIENPMALPGNKGVH